MGKHIGNMLSYMCAKFENCHIFVNFMTKFRFFFFFQKLIEIDAFQAPEQQKCIRKRTSGSKSRKNDHEAKTHRFGSHLGAILVSSWGTWETFGGLFGHLGANWSQHKAILSHLGANLSPP